VASISAQDIRMRGQPLHPYDPAEAIGTAEAARRSGRSERTVREWCVLHRIGRKIAGRWAVSAPALDMFLAGDQETLNAYLDGDRLSVRVRSYFARRGIISTCEGSTASVDSSAPTAPLN
jgi:hypothetical protein